METLDWANSARSRLRSVLDAPAPQPDLALLALRAALIRAQDKLQPALFGSPELAPLLGGSLATSADLRDVLALGLPGIGGRLSEDDDGYFNLALSPELKVRSGNAVQSYRGTFSSPPPDPALCVYRVADQPVAGVLRILEEATGPGQFFMRRSVGEPPAASLEILYEVCAEQQSVLVQHVVSEGLSIEVQRLTSWDHDSTAAPAESAEWLLDAIDVSLAFIARHRAEVPPHLDVDVQVIHCGLVERQL